MAKVFNALVDPAALVAWRAPDGMRGEMHRFEARQGGGYRMTLHYETTGDAHSGKSTDTTDSFEGRFLAIEPDRRIVEEIRFESGDPTYAAPMTIETILAETPSGTRIDMTFRDVPDAIAPDDHAAGIASSLEKLAALVE